MAPPAPSVRGLVALFIGCAGAAAGCAEHPAPPPAPSVVSVPPVDAAVAPTSTDSSAAPSSAGCTDPYKGRATRQLVAFAMERAAQAKPCYNRALAIEPGVIQGTMSVLVVLSESGAVCSTRIESSEMPDYMNTCVMQALADATYPAPVGGCLKMRVPLSFKPLEADAGTP